MPAPESVRQLVKRFEENIDSYRSSRYNETQLRREFLDLLFEELGWDVLNKAGYAKAYKDVIHEDALEVKGATKARHEKIVSLMERMLELHKSPSARTPGDKVGKPYHEPCDTA